MSVLSSLNVFVFVCLLPAATNAFISDLISCYSPVLDTSTPTTSTVTVDCKLDDIKYTDTKDKIAVRVYNQHGQLLSAKWMVGTDTCRRWGGAMSFHSGIKAKRANFIIIEAYGSDAFLLDKVDYEQKYDGKCGNIVNKGWGRNGGNAWCLSTDPNDTFGSKARNCYRCLQFSWDGNAYAPHVCPSNQPNHSRQLLGSNSTVSEVGSAVGSLRGKDDAMVNTEDPEAQEDLDLLSGDFFEPELIELASTYSFGNDENNNLG